VGKAKKLTKGQQRRIKANHDKRLTNNNRGKKADDSDLWQAGDLSETQEGTVISRFGQHADVESTDGIIYRCNMRRSIDSLVCGDKVLWRSGIEVFQDGNQKTIESQSELTIDTIKQSSKATLKVTGIIEAVQERDSVLSRPDVYDGVKPIAANISQILIVSSVLPVFNADIIDRYLVAAEQTNITPVIVLNKMDLYDSLEASVKSDIEQQLAIYKQVGYQILYASSESGKGLEELKTQLSAHTSIFVGQSGVGKSTLVNALMPELALATKQVSSNSGLGQHTTTVARLFHFNKGGNLIDSPGIREFGLWHLSPEQVCNGFIEFEDFLGLCKFRDCKHQNDPGCALIEATKNNEINPKRLASFQRILSSLGENKLTSRFND
jgi:ribosome biogenesis GTPase